VKVLLPAFSGLPYHTPAVLNDSPVLQAPVQDGSDQVYGGVPPVALMVKLYAVPTVPEGSDTVVIVKVVPPLIV
jgi:hypothetical protein